MMTQPATSRSPRNNDVARRTLHAVVTRAIAGVGAAAIAVMTLGTPAFAAPDDPIHIPDANLRACLNNVLDRTRAPDAEITEAEATAYAGTMRMDQCGISDLTGMEHFTGVTQLHLAANNISDLTPIGNLTEITSLSMYNNNITDLSPLTDHPALGYLSVTNNAVSDLTPVSGMPRLHTFRASNNAISDATPLANHPVLYQLEIDENNVSDLEAIGTIPNLQELYAGSNNISDLSPLIGHQKLRTLDLDDNSVTSLAPLANIPNLSSVSFHDNQISSVQPLAGLPELVNVWLANNHVADLSPLQYLTNLRSVIVDDQVVHLDGLYPENWYPNPVYTYDGTPLPLTGASYNANTNSFRTGSDGQGDLTWDYEHSFPIPGVAGGGTVWFSGKLTYSVRDADPTDPGPDPVDPTNPGTDPADPQPVPDTELTDATRGDVSVLEDEVEQGQSFTLEVPSEAGNEVRVWLHSRPVLLGTVQLDASGRATFTVPAATAVGDHRIVAQRLDRTLVGWDGLRVIASARPTPPVTSPTPGTPAPSASAPASKHPTTKALVATGSEEQPFMGVAWLLTLAGAVLLSVTRRRKTESH